MILMFSPVHAIMSGRKTLHPPGRDRTVTLPVVMRRLPRSLSRTGRCPRCRMWSAKTRKCWAGQVLSVPWPKVRRLSHMHVSPWLSIHSLSRMAAAGSCMIHAVLRPMMQSLQTLATPKVPFLPHLTQKLGSALSLRACSRCWAHRSA